MNQKPKSNRSFNYYWIYALIGVVLLGLNLFNFNGGAKKTGWKEFAEMVRNGDVARIVVVSNEMIAEIYLKPEAIKENPKYEEWQNRGFGSSGVAKGPHYYIQIGSVEQFSHRLPFDA